MIEGWSKEHLDWADYAVNLRKKIKKKPESEHENHVITRTIDFFKRGIKASMQFTRVNRGTLRNV